MAERANSDRELWVDGIDTVPQLMKGPDCAPALIHGQKQSSEVPGVFYPPILDKLTLANFTGLIGSVAHRLTSPIKDFVEDLGIMEPSDKTEY